MLPTNKILVVLISISKPHPSVSFSFSSWIIFHIFFLILNPTHFPTWPPFTVPVSGPSSTTSSIDASFPASSAISEPSEVCGVILFLLRITREIVFQKFHQFRVQTRGSHRSTNERMEWQKKCRFFSERENLTNGMRNRRFMHYKRRQ